MVLIDNRELLLDAALDLFYAKGYDAVGVQEIVDRAGVTKPTLYYYFGSKIGLLRNLLERGYNILEKGVLEASRMNASLPEVLYKVAREFFDYAASQLGNMRGRQKLFAVGFTGVLNHHIMTVSYGLSENEKFEISNETTYEIVHQFLYGIYSLQEEMKMAEWYEEAVFYQIYPIGMTGARSV